MVIYYLFGSVIDTPHLDRGRFFKLFRHPPFLPLLSQFAFMALTGFFVWRGISKGKNGETASEPLLFLMLALIVIRSLTLPGAMEGVRFFFKPDFSNQRSNGNIGFSSGLFLHECWLWNHAHLRQLSR
jgi:NSS family neurotransmitter:Na+ symporter